MSVYNLRHNFAFIHVPKNAGTSIRSVIGGEDFDKIDVAYRTHRDPALANHFPVWRIEQLLRETGETIPFEHMFKFMVVRNPFERMVSLYNHRGKKLHASYEGQPRNTPEDIFVHERGFEYWLLHTPSRMDRFHTRTPQSNWGKDSRGDFVTEVLRMETLDEDWEWLRQFLQLKRTQIPLQNSNGGSKDYREWYTEKSKAHIERFFAEDIERFGYAF